MALLDSIFPDLAVKEIAINGISATLHSYTGSYDRTTGENTRTETSNTVKVLPMSRVSQRYVDGEVVKVSDSSTLIAAKDLEIAPTIGSKLTANGIKWDIVKVSPIYSGDEVAAYKLFMRGE